MIRLRFNGKRVCLTPNGAGEIISDEYSIFQKMESLESSGSWSELLILCQEQINANPDWLTPYFYAGFAYGNTPGHFEDAMKMFKYVAEKSGDDPSYIQAKKLTQAFEELDLRS